MQHLNCLWFAAIIAGFGIALNSNGGCGKSNHSTGQPVIPETAPEDKPASLTKTGSQPPSIETPSVSKVPPPDENIIMVPAVPTAPAPTDIYLFPPAYDFGRVKPGAKLSVQIEVVRPMFKPLKLGRLYSDCPCVTVSSRSISFRANEPATVDVSYDATGLAGVKNDIVIIQVLEPAPAVLRFNISLDATIDN
ncbi:MAG: DUF1573 domain-containing protein [Planctomycetota bacterium]